MDYSKIRPHIFPCNHKTILHPQPAMLAFSFEGFDIQIYIPSMAPAQLLNWTLLTFWNSQAVFNWAQTLDIQQWTHHMNSQPQQLPIYSLTPKNGKFHTLPWYHKANHQQNTTKRKPTERKWKQARYALEVAYSYHPFLPFARRTCIVTALAILGDSFSWKTERTHMSCNIPVKP